jgi:phosphocarrier protein HPr
MNMLEKLFIIRLNFGLHARPSSILVQRLQDLKLDSAEIERAGVRANLKSVLELLTLSCPHGTEVKVRISGKDEDKAMEIVQQILLGNSLDELLKDSD